MLALTENCCQKKSESYLCFARTWCDGASLLLAHSCSTIYIRIHMCFVVIVCSSVANSTHTPRTRRLLLFFFFLNFTQLKRKSEWVRRIEKGRAHEEKHNSFVYETNLLRPRNLDIWTKRSSSDKSRLMATWHRYACMCWLQMRTIFCIES